MKMMIVASSAAGFAPRPLVPTFGLVEGRGVPAAGHVARRLRGVRPFAPTEPDSVMEALPV